MKQIYVYDARFTATTTDGQQIELSWDDIGTQFPDDDVFYCATGTKEPIPCLLSSLSIIIG